MRYKKILKLWNGYTIHVEESDIHWRQVVGCDFKLRIVEHEGVMYTPQGIDGGGDIWAVFRGTVQN